MAKPNPHDRSYGQHPSTTLASFRIRPYFGVFKTFWAWLQRANGRHFAGFWEVHHVASPLRQHDARVVLVGLSISAGRIGPEMPRPTTGSGRPVTSCDVRSMAYDCSGRESLANHCYPLRGVLAEVTTGEEPVEVNHRRRLSRDAEPSEYWIGGDFQSSIDDGGMRVSMPLSGTWRADGSEEAGIF